MCTYTHIHICNHIDGVPSWMHAPSASISSLHTGGGGGDLPSWMQGSMGSMDLGTNTDGYNGADGTAYILPPTPTHPSTPTHAHLLAPTISPLVSRRNSLTHSHILTHLHVDGQMGVTHAHAHAHADKHTHNHTEAQCLAPLAAGREGVGGGGGGCGGGGVGGGGDGHT